MTRDEMTLDLLTAAGFLTERQDLLYVYAVRSVAGSGWDVVVRIDGIYSDRANAEDAAVDIQDWMTALTDVGKTERYWWGGPPTSDASEEASDPPPLPDLDTAITDRCEHVTSIIGSAPQRPQDQRRQAHFHEWHPAALRPASRDERPSVQGILAPREASSRPADRGPAPTRERREEGQIRP